MHTDLSGPRTVWTWEPGRLFSLPDVKLGRQQQTLSSLRTKITKFSRRVNTKISRLKFFTPQVTPLNETLFWGLTFSAFTALFSGIAFL